MAKCSDTPHIRSLKRKHAALAKKLKKLRSFQVTADCICCSRDVWFANENALKNALTRIGEGSELIDELGINHGSVVPDYTLQGVHGKSLDWDEIARIGARIGNSKTRMGENQ